VTGFQGRDSDLTDFEPFGELVPWGFDDEERALLMKATTHIPNLRAIVARAKPHAEVAGLLVVEATVEELGEMYSLVDEMSDYVRRRRERELLECLRASLCTSIDGF
jgi:hypothetical protein